MSRTNRFEDDPDVRWGIVLPPEQRQIRGMQGPEPISAAEFGNFMVHGEEALGHPQSEIPQFEPAGPIELQHLGIAVAHENIRRAGSGEVAEAA